MIDINSTTQASFGMPVDGRVRAAQLRLLPMTAASLTCASVHHVDAVALSTGTDVAVITDAFPGTPAWSPPI